MRTPLVGNIHLMNRLNKARILTLIKDRGPISRVELARLTSISHTAISTNVRTLLKQGLVMERDWGDSTGGRKPVLLEFQPKGRHVVGIDIGKSHLNVALADLSGEVLVRSSEALTSPGESHVFERLFGMVDRMIPRGLKKDRVLGVGVSVPGIVEHTRGLCRWSIHLGWENVPVGERIAERYGVASFVEKDSNAVGLAEMWFGEKKSEGLVLGITLDAGIGLSIVDGEHIYRGVDGSAGEIGHMMVDKHGPRCPCGGRGCLELFASEKAILEGYERRAKRLGAGEDALSAGIHSVIHLAEQGDEAALGAIQEACVYLGLAVMNLIRVFNPRAVVFGGKTASSTDLFVSMTREAIKRHSKPLWKIGTEIRLSPLGADSALKGALALVLRKLFTVDTEESLFMSSDSS